MLPILALALGAFGIGLTEFAVVGLLPQIAGGLDVSQSGAGFLVSGYAITVAVGALVVTGLLFHTNRKQALLILLGLFVAGNLVDAIAPTFAIALVGRVVAALCHGAYFGLSLALAMDLAPARRRNQAQALVLTGLTTANVVGVPVGTFIGQHYGWRATFVGITLIGVAALVAVAVAVPREAGAVRAGGSLRAEAAAFRRPALWAAMAVSVLAFAGIFGTFTYIAYTLTEVSGFAAASIAWLLVLFGVGQFLGTFVGGKGADRSVSATLTVGLGALTLFLAAFALLADQQAPTIAALILVGAAGFGTAPAMQTHVLRSAHHAPTLASSANIAAINVGIFAGSWLSGLLVAAGNGYRSPVWLGAGLAAAAFLLALGSVARHRRTASVANIGQDLAMTSSAVHEDVACRVG